ncbi:MAG: GAF domain-containing protein, partial [Candidatus Promineifilaceae bacterium]
LEELKQVIDYDTATVTIFSKGIEWELAVGVGYKDEEFTNRVSSTLLKESPILNQMARDHKPVISDNVNNLPGWMWIPGAEHVRSFLAVAMIAYDRMIGVLMLDNSKEAYFDEDDLDLANTLSRTLAVAVEKAQLYEAMQQRLSEQDALLAVSQAVSSSLDLDIVLTKLVEQMARAINVTSAYISDWDPESGISTVIAEYVSPEASEREKASDLGLTYDLLRDFDDDQEWLREGKIVTEHIGDSEGDYFTLQHYQKFGAKSVIFVPLMVKGNAVGYAELWESRRHREFTPAEIALSQAIAQQTAVAIENARLFAEKKEQLSLSKTLQDVGALLTTQLSLHEVFDQIFDLLAQIVNFESTSVQLLEEDGRLVVAAGTGLASTNAYRSFATEHSEEIITRFSDERKVNVIPDTDADPGWIHVSGMESVRSWIGAALMVKGQLIGILNVDSLKPNTYSARNGRTVLTFANQAAVAIENARLYEETRLRANEMWVLNQVAAATYVLLDIDSLLQQTTSMVARSLYPEHFGFLLLNEATGQLFAHPSFFGASAEYVNRQVPLDASISGRVLETGQPVIIPDVTNVEKYYSVVSTTRSEIAVPLIVRDKTVGVINVESSRINAFSTNDLRFLTTLAGQVATFIERTELYEAQRKYTAHLAQEVNQRTAALRAERDRMQAILDNAGEGIFFTDDAGMILYVNSAMMKVTGFSNIDLLHRTPAKWPGIDHAPDLLEGLQEAIRKGEAWRGEVVGKRKDNRPYDIYLTVTPIFSSEGSLIGFVAVHSDISYLKEVERLKARFISNVSHELRTPLTVIETYTTLLKQGKPERQDHYLSILSQETKRLTRLIQDVLDLSRLGADTTTIPMGPVLLDEVLKRVVNTFLPQAENKKIDLQIELDEPLQKVWGNLGQIEQVITNLLSNGLTYTPE